MTIDLEKLVHLHADLPDDVAGMLAFAAAVALEREHHEPGVKLRLTIKSTDSEEELLWRPRGGADANMVDAKRATEDGAECIALGVVGRHRSQWRLVRRLQSDRRERADWLFAATEDGEQIVLEISGTREASLATRLKSKRAQALASHVGDRAAACVVRFIEPEASIWESSHDGSP